MAGCRRLWKRRKPELVASAPLSLTAPLASSPQRIRVGGNVQKCNLITKVDPVYTAAGKQARIQGTVRFQVILGADGRVRNLQLVSGRPLLVLEAQAAVQQYVYRPTLLNGQPVEVVTTVDVNFSLAPTVDASGSPCRI